MKRLIFILVIINYLFPTDLLAQDNAVIYIVRLKKSTNAEKSYKIFFENENIGTFSGINLAQTAEYKEKWIVAKYQDQNNILIKVTDRNEDKVIGKLNVNVLKGYSYYIEFNPAAAYGINPLKLYSTVEGHEKFSSAEKRNIKIVNSDIESKVWSDKDRQLASNDIVENLQGNQEQKADLNQEINNNVTAIIAKSDVDLNIPSSSKTHPKRYALIIGNEDYTSYNKGMNKEINVDFAKNDAEVFGLYCKKTLGVPEKQVRLLTNATAGQMNEGLEWLSYMMDIEQGEAEVFFYYSGHGLPEEGTQKPYLIPVDVSGTNLKFAISLEALYTELTKKPSQKVTIFLDACFSGGGRNQGLLAMKGVKIKPKDEQVSGNLVVFTSSSGEETSAVYREKQHGYFTYFLLKKLQETQGPLSYKEVADYVVYNVRKEVANTGKKQMPQVNFSVSVANDWEKWQIK